MSDNMNQQNGQGQQMYGQGQQMYNQGQQMYGQGQQMYNQGQQMYNQGQQMYNQGQQMYGQPGQQMYGQPGQQMYGQPGQQMNRAPKQKMDFSATINKWIDWCKNNLKIVIIAGSSFVALIFMIVILAALCGHGKQSPKGVAKAFTTAYAKDNAKGLYKITDTKWTNYKNSIYRIDKDDIIDSYDDNISSFKKNVKSYGCGKIKKIKITDLDVKKYKGSNLLTEKASFLVYGIRISQFAEVEMDWEVIGEDDDMDYEAKVYTYKRMGKWYYWSSNVYAD